MPDLIAKSALQGQSVTIGGVTLAEAAPGPITSIALYPGGGKAVAKGLKPLGLTFPAPNSFNEKKGARIFWTGRDQAFLTGALPPVLEGAALTDQSDGWTTLALEGPLATEALARLVPMDLRLTAFPVGRVCRTQVNHMNAIVLRIGPYAIELMVFRSMARTAWHEIQTTLEQISEHARVKP